MDSKEMTCVVDSRETKLRDGWEEYCGIPVENRGLDIGDVCFMDSSGAHLLIMERKTVADLKASLKDGRWEEQKERIKSNRGTAVVVYVIEGRPSVEPWYVSCILGSQIRDGICVINTADVAGTLFVIRKMWEKMKSGDWVSTGESKQFGTRRMKKSDNNTPSEIWKSQLACIPRLSLEMAKKIIEVYPTLGEFQSNATTESLESLQITPKRKLGPVLAKKLIETFN
jgi:ERCC4-type nuclease